MSTIKITKQQRQDLGDLLNHLYIIGGRVDEIPLRAGDRRAFVNDLEAAGFLAQSLLGVEVRGRCEGCSTTLMVGDLVHHTEEDGRLCDDCAPTNGDVLDQYRATIANIDSGADIITNADDLRERLQLLSAYSPEDLAKKALTELT